MIRKVLTLLALWLTIAATGLAHPVDSILDEVELRDGTVVKPQKAPRRAPKDDYVYTYKGVKYTYITEHNYTRYFNTSVHTPEDYGWYTDNEGWFVNAEKAYITAASIDADNFPSSGEVYILNDLVGFFADHTHLGCIADNAFRYMSGVRRVYFQDCDAMSYTANSDFYFFIGDCAFADCENLEEVNLMQWTTSGSNHWQALPPTAVKRIWGSMLNNSPKAWIRVGTSVYQQYLGSQTWVQVRDRITTFEHASDDITVNGAVYSFLKAEDGSALSNADEQHEEIMKTLRLWNADYQEFNAASLLSDKSRTTDNANLWYTTVKGVDADYLKQNDGVLRIFNDPGSYYNYKTIAIRRGAFENCDDLKAVEFWQTNGRSDNSYSDLRLVIESGAFKNCKNLEEIRLFYKVEDGTDRWQVLGPENVIPGEDIFSADDRLAESSERLEALAQQKGKTVNELTKEEIRSLDEGMTGKRVRIVVSPDRYVDFVNAPNWAPYAGMIVAADYMPSEKDPIVRDGITYDYSASSSGIMQSDQVVTQGLSWWNVPIIIAEIALAVSSFGSSSGATGAASSTSTVAGDIAGDIAVAETEALASSARSASVKLAQETVNTMTSYFSFDEKIEAVKELGGKFLFNAEMAQGRSLNILKQAGVINVTFEGEVKFIAGLETEQLAPYFASLRQFLTFYINKATEYSAKQTLLANTLSAQLAKLTATLTATEGTQQIAATQLISKIMAASFGGAVALAGQVAEDEFKEGMKNNIMANMHQVGMVGGQLITTPSKELVYHTHVSHVDDNVTDVEISINPKDNTRLVAIDQHAFRGKTTLTSITFKENDDVMSYETTPMVLVIPDSAFAGCTGLRTVDLRLHTDENGIRSRGPEHFIISGKDIFAGCDTTNLQILVDEERLEDFTTNDSWVRYANLFVKAPTVETVQYTEFGVNYAYAYDSGNKKEEKLGGRTIEHLIAVGPDDDYINDNNGALGFFNDIGSWNNYKLDYARKNAFRKNANIKSVSFWDLAGWLFTGSSYTDLQMTLRDSCFAECPNLEYVDMLYLRTDGSNIAEPLRPNVVQLGNGVFAGSPKVRFKMTDRQMEWFQADTTWAKYQDRFLPCLFLPNDPVVLSKLSDLKYRTDVARAWYDNNASKWGDWLDVTRAASGSYFNGKFSGNSDLQSFPDFKRFELIGLDYVGGSWFQNCTNLNGIELPSTTKHIGGWAFYGCSKLKEITIPAAVETIDACAFQYSGLKTVRCEGTTPAKLDYSVFDLTSYNGFAIYVPAEAVDAYKQAWPSYAQYIKSNADDRKLTVVDVNQPGRLAEKLGLTMIMDGDRLRSVGGAYWKYDSLTVSGHLNGLDVGVLRHMMGADAWDSDPTDGRLRYLDLHDAHLDKDTKYSYNLWGVDEYLEKENWVGEYMFHNCKAIETLILPASVTEIGENAFEEATNLRHLCFGEKLERYTRDLIEDNKEGLEELVFLTDQHATSESYDPWEGYIKQVFTKKSQLGDYISDPALANRAQGIDALFEDDQIMIALKNHRFYFPSEYLKLETTMNPRGSYVDGNLYIFYRNSDIKYFDDFNLFTNIRELEFDFDNCTSLERITLPDSLKHIGYYAFRGCGKLGTIRISTDSVPELDRDALRDLPSDFRIIVPKTHVKRYREKWDQYADHIVGDEDSYRKGLVEVTLTEPNTLAEKLGLTVKTTTKSLDFVSYTIITSLTGDYSNIRALKVNGPISGLDFAVMRYLGGYCPWENERNYFGQLEYLDLSDAYTKSSKASLYSEVLYTGIFHPSRGWLVPAKAYTVEEDDEIPERAFLKSYSLKTIILPRTCKKVRTRAFQECEYLETLVIGDDCEEFNWSSLDDCASMTRMYILSNKKMEMDQECWVKRAMCNNYSPTFDAFYVRPSLYNEYVADEAYVGSFNRTNNISSGIFKDDESFAAFAAHAAATEDDLRYVNDVKDWFRGRETATDLNALQYTCIDTLRTADMASLTQMRNITLPASISGIGKDAFKNATGLRYVDLSQCADYAPTLAAEGGVRSLGIGENTLVYVPARYGETSDVNVAVGDSTSGVFHAQTFRLVDGQDYCVPYDVTADNVENTRTLAKSPVPYTVCLPYALDIPDGAKVYRLSGRGSNELIFAQHTGRMEAMEPYLVWTENSDALLSTANVTLPSSNNGQTVGSQQSSVGYTLRGTLNSIGNQEAVELGAYVMNDDAKWHPVLSDTDEHKAVTIPAFRCFLLQSRYSNARTIGMTLEDSEGITQLRTIDSDGTERVYDLSGRRVDGNAKGIVIKNGQKIIQK